VARPELRPARVATVDRGAVSALSADRTSERVTLGGDLLAVVAADAAAAPCTGDWAGLRDWSDGRTTLEVLLPRRTSFVRASASGESVGQALAVNMDDVLITVSLAVEPNANRVERLAALAWESGATPVLVLTKSDLATDAAHVAADFELAAPGVRVLVVSVVTGEGMDDLTGLVQAPSAHGAAKTLALLGQSGAGKSTLVNALARESDVPELAVRDVSATGKGRHTTVRRELVMLDGGGLVLDTPGLRGVGLVEASDGVDRVFPEIDALAAECRFADCSHDREPGCAVLGAVESGVLPVRRLESYRKLSRESAWIATRTDARARAEARRRWIQITKDMRRHGTVRP